MADTSVLGYLESRWDSQSLEVLTESLASADSREVSGDGLRRCINTVVQHFKVYGMET